MTTPEKKVKQKVVKYLKEYEKDIYYFFPATGGYGRSGVPDIVGCYKGKFFAIECKAGNNTTTKLQEFEINKINASGGVAWVVNEVNVDSVKVALESLLVTPPRGDT